MVVQDFLNEVRGLSEPTKKKILVLSTIVVMGVIIFVWLEYFNTIVMPSVASFADIATTTAATATGTAPAAIASPGSVPSGGSSGSGAGFFGSVGGSFAAAWQGFVGMFGNGTQYIKPNHG